MHLTKINRHIKLLFVRDKEVWVILNRLMVDLFAVKI